MMSALAHGGHLRPLTCVDVTLPKLVGAKVGVPTALSRRQLRSHLSFHPLLPSYAQQRTVTSGGRGATVA